MSDKPQQERCGKHLKPSACGENPQLLNYVLGHCHEHQAQKDLRTVIETEERAVMSGAPDEAALLSWLVGLTRATKIVEVGVFRGATALSIALALPTGGKLIGLDVSEEFVSTARPFWKAAGVEEKIDIVIAPASDTMAKMLERGEAGTVDLVFIDADKQGYDTYYELALNLLKPNGIIAVDNTLWGGSTASFKSVGTPDDKDTVALATLNDKIKADKRVDAFMLSIADGLYLCRKL